MRQQDQLIKVYPIVDIGLLKPVMRRGVVVSGIDENFKPSYGSVLVAFIPKYTELEMIRTSHMGHTVVYNGEEFDIIQTTNFITEVTPNVEILLEEYHQLLKTARLATLNASLVKSKLPLLR